jgi:beta-galactosidase
MVLRGTFEIAELANNTEVTLWPKALAEEESVYVNGHLIAQGVKRFDPVKAYKLDNSILRQGKNVYAVVGTPLIERYQYDELNTDPGIIQVTKPAETWKRKLFNGLTQIIVQSTKEHGEIVLEAASDGLIKGEIKIQTEKVNLIPSIE